MRKHGVYNSICDVKGILVGHFTDDAILSGVTVIIAEHNAIGGVDVRGSAPGTWETDLLNSINLIDQINAVTLTGNSVYGLDSGVGVRKWLTEKGYGYPIGTLKVPIAPGAVIFDLNRGKTKEHLNIESGYKACQNAISGKITEGNIGAGTGAVSGGLKGGVGTASEVLENGITVGAIAVINSAGKIFYPETGAIYARHLELGNEFGKLKSNIILGTPTYSIPTSIGANTTIGVIATDAKLTKTQSNKIAQMAHDGIARAIYPCHTMGDGDTIFVMATGEKNLSNDKILREITLLGSVAADVFARAIVKGVLAADSVGKYKSYKDSYPDSFEN
ncbi:P1 family peptidase [Candidatus Bathyarchaeota archaeon]|nr:P1 family peptidase [Candidatus Bathyarchaeota archaeon]